MSRIYHVSSKIAAFIRIREELLFLVFNCIFWCLIGIIVGTFLWLVRMSPEGLLVSYSVSVSSLTTLLFGYLGGMLQIARQN